jgi:hypothetical protein
VFYRDASLVSKSAHRHRLKTPRYFPFGFAFQKRRLFMAGARPVIYGTADILGTELAQGESGYVAGRRIHHGGLPVNLQYPVARSASSAPALWRRGSSRKLRVRRSDVPCPRLLGVRGSQAPVGRRARRRRAHGLTESRHRGGKRSGTVLAKWPFCQRGTAAQRAHRKLTS